jgi:hypothetical protein
VATGAKLWAACAEVLFLTAGQRAPYGLLEKTHTPLPHLINPCIFRSGAAEDTSAQPDARPGSSRERMFRRLKEGERVQWRPNLSGEVQYDNV